MFTPTLRCECAQPVSDRLMRKWCIDHSHIVSIRPGCNFIFRNPARNCTIIIAYCVNNLQCIGYFLLDKKIDELTSEKGYTENRTRVICFIGVYLYH